MSLSLSIMHIKLTSSIKMNGDTIENCLAPILLQQKFTFKKLGTIFFLKYTKSIPIY
jgi:hypothetical protein